MIAFMRGMFGAALKTNPYLERAVITGILRVAKESLFSGLNNLKVYSLIQSHTDNILDLLKKKYRSITTIRLSRKSPEIRIGITVIK